MIRQLRETGPVFLVPAAWLVVAGAHLEMVSDHAIFIAHLVMATFIAFFLTTGWSAMDDGALAGWRAVMVVGLGLTIAGIGGFVLDTEWLLALSLVGWMALPAAGLGYTGLELPAARRQYFGGAILTLLGAGLYLASLAGFGDQSFALGAIAFVGVGQTIGIVDGTLREADGEAS